jgi:hypothetical protein
MQHRKGPSPLAFLLFIVAALLAVAGYALAADTFAVYHATWNPPAGSDDAKQWGVVPLSAYPKEVKYCLWSTPNRLLLDVPPTDRQVQRLADACVNGGPNPLRDIDPNCDVPVVPKGSLLLLDGEGRDDATMFAAIDKARAYGGSRFAFTTYALRMTLSDGAWEWLADSQFVWTRSFEARRLQVRGAIDQQRIVMLELYPVEGSIDLQLRAMDFTVANLRRLYPDKKLYVITRGDSFPPGFTWTNGMSTHRMDPELMERMAWYIRSRFDGAIVWGIRGAGNVEFAEKILRPRGWDAVIK